MELASSSYNSSLKPRLQVSHRHQYHRHLHHSQKLLFSFSPIPIPHLRTSISTAPRRRFFVLAPPRAAASASSAGGGGGVGGGGGGRRVYRQSQVQQQRSLPAVPLKEITAFILPAGAFLAITFVLWKVVEKVLVPKPKGSVSGENRSSVPGVKWSFAPGTNLPSGFNFKIERDSRQKLNEFAKELRSFRSVDMSGRNFGDEGLFFLAENLGYNHVGASVYLLQSQSLRATLNELQSSPNEMFETSRRHCLWFLQKMKINVHRAVLFSECRGSGLFW